MMSNLLNTKILNVKIISHQLLFVILTAIIMLPVFLTAFDAIPDDPVDMTEPVPYIHLKELLDEVNRVPHIDVSIIGHSIQRRNIYLVKLKNGKKKNPIKIFLYGQQHGNEPAGKDALLYLIKELAEHPRRLPKNIELYIIPQVNPDGAENMTRRNSNDTDLNRDHVLLNEPETQILHQAFRNILPHIAVDCHEFTRDSGEYIQQGWLEWPQIMMDCANNPYFDSTLYQKGVQFCNYLHPVLADQNINYTRYYVGGPPPEQEMRHSFPEIDDARNGFGGYGGLSFIIESGVYRSNPNSHSDLGLRVKAYLAIFHELITNKTLKKNLVVEVDESRMSPPDDFIPVNYFWANAEPQITEVKVVDIYSGKIENIRSANFMHDVVVKSSVSKPEAYIIKDTENFVFQELLDRHGFNYSRLNGPRELLAEVSLLNKIEQDWDPIYSRYGGRQIILQDSLQIHDFDKGDLYVPIDQLFSRKLILLLEPNMLYGLYQHEKFMAAIDSTGRIPVYRVFQEY